MTVQNYLTKKEVRKNYNSSKNQSIKEKFIRKEVYYCVSFLISELANKDEYMDELMDICIQYDYESVLDDAGIEIEENSTAQDTCENNNIKPYQVEAYEHWIVSDWLAKKLKRKGEMVNDDFLGLTIWGRCTTGQAILLDNVISEICADLEILEGQKNEWSVI